MPKQTEETVVWLPYGDVIWSHPDLNVRPPEANRVNAIRYSIHMAKTPRKALETTPLTPVTVYLTTPSPSVEPHYYKTDGTARGDAFRLEGWKEVPCVVRVGSWAEAIKHAALANFAATQYPLDTRQRDRAIAMLLSEAVGMTVEQIAKETNSTPEWVRAISRAEKVVSRYDKQLSTNQRVVLARIPETVEYTPTGASEPIVVPTRELVAAKAATRKMGSPTLARIARAIEANPADAAAAIHLHSDPNDGYVPLEQSGGVVIDIPPSAGRVPTEVKEAKREAVNAITKVTPQTPLLDALITAHRLGEAGLMTLLNSTTPDRRTRVFEAVRGLASMCEAVEANFAAAQPKSPLETLAEEIANK